MKEKYLDHPYPPVSVNIIGSCVSRESFNHMPWFYNVNLKEYIHKISPLFIDSAEDWPTLNESEVELAHNFIKRCTCTLFNGTAQQRLLNNKGDWIVIDDFYFIASLFELSRNENGVNKQRIFQIPHEMHNEVRRVVCQNEKYDGYSIRMLDATPNYTLLIPKLATFLKKNWGKNIIVVDAEQARNFITDVPWEKNLEIDQSSVYLRKLATKKLLDCLDCFYIPLQSELTSRDGVSVHYGLETYEYIAKTIGDIIQKPRGWRLNCQRYLIDFQMKQSKTLYNRSYPLNTILQKADSIIANREYDKYGTCLGILINSVDASSLGKIEKRIASIYSNEKYKGYNLDAALQWICKSLNKGGNFYQDYFILLDRKGTQESYE